MLLGLVGGDTTQQHLNGHICRGPGPTLLLFVIHYSIIGESFLPLTSDVKPIVIKELDEAFRRLDERGSYQWTDFFDVEIALWAEISQGAIAQLSPRFMDENNNNYFFKPKYNKAIPIERLALCLESLWVR